MIVVRFQFGLIGVLFLAGCGGSATPVDVPPPGAPEYVGNTYADTATQIRMTGDEFGNVGQAGVTVHFDTATTATVTINGLVSTLTQNPGDNLFYSGNGKIVLFVAPAQGGYGSAPGAYYIRIVRDVTGSDVYVDYYYDGNRTDHAAVPLTGTATYLGTATMADGSGASATGNLQLNVNFQTAKVSGTIVGGLPVAPTATFQIVETDIVGNGFTSTLTSGDVTILATAGSSYIDGNFYGPLADDILGVLRVKTTIGNGGGTFQASK